MSSLERKMAMFMAGYDLAWKEILTGEILPPEIMKQLRQWIDLKEGSG